MKTYPDQPEVVAHMDEVRKIVEEVLDEDLPECAVNEWFVETVYCANMLDKIIERLR